VYASRIKFEVNYFRGLRPLTSQFKRVYYLVTLRTGCADFFPLPIQFNIMAFLLRADARLSQDSFKSTRVDLPGKAQPSTFQHTKGV
jgi:hypothetical protein